jgi:hypothetical protein
MYDLVWSRPMTKVAEDLGIPYVALKKICGPDAAVRVLGKTGRQSRFNSTARQIHNTSEP